MYCYKINNSNTIYVCYEYINECIRASRKFNQQYGMNKPVKGKIIVPETKQANQTKETILPLSENTILAHKLWGNGRVLSTNDNGIMEVAFRNKTVRFVYPDAIKQGYLIVA